MTFVVQPHLLLCCYFQEVPANLGWKILMSVFLCFFVVACDEEVKRRKRNNVFFFFAVGFETVAPERFDMGLLLALAEDPPFFRSKVSSPVETPGQLYYSQSWFNLNLAQQGLSPRRCLRSSIIFASSFFFLRGCDSFFLTVCTILSHY